ncbi:MAG: hypothetical protein II871_07405 [Clostridia bacterium]|nr:hypothetical protein [Clostridia bacterium]
MGENFRKTFIRGKNSIIYESWIEKAAKDIGYTKSVEGKGVPVGIVLHPENSEWFGLTSPLIETDDGIAETFIRALSREFKAPALDIRCDGDHAVCRIIDGVNGRDAEGRINTPKNGSEPACVDAAAWLAACKKKWKCSEKQFEELFSGEYASAADGLNRLADIVEMPWGMISAYDPVEEGLFEMTFWIMPQAEFEANPIPRSLSERLGAYLDECFSERLTSLGYKRFGGSSLRWHKVFGEEGKELIASIVFTVRYDYEIELFFGVQTLCCPLVLSDKYFPMHDWPAYWINAKFEFPRLMEFNPRLPTIDGVMTFDPLNSPEKAFAYMEYLILPILERVTDTASLCEFTKSTPSYEMHFKNGILSYSFTYRMLVEAILDNDAEGASKAANLISSGSCGTSFCLKRDKSIEKQMLPELPDTYREQGFEICMQALKKVRDANMKKLKKGGVV